METKVLMTISAESQKGITRRMLQGNWRQAVLGTFIYMAAMTVPTAFFEAFFSKNPMTLMTISMIYLILTTGAFTLGYFTFILGVFREKDPPVSEVLSGFSHPIRAFMLFLMMLLYVYFYAIPSCFVIMIGVSLGNKAIMGVLSLVALALLYLPIKAALNYSQIFFIAADNEDMPILQVLRHSKFLMEGNRWKFFCLNFSFVGWVILCTVPSTFMTMYTAQSGDMNAFTSNVLFLIASFGYLWLTPYMNGAMAGFYEIITGHLTIKRVSDIKLSPNEEEVELEKIEQGKTE